MDRKEPNKTAWIHNMENGIWMSLTITGDSSENQISTLMSSN